MLHLLLLFALIYWFQALIVNALNGSCCHHHRDNWYC
jgi:hypothetical protein